MPKERVYSIHALSKFFQAFFCLFQNQLFHTRNFRNIATIRVSNSFKQFDLTLYLIETPFNTFANRADPDQAALVRAA